MQAKRQDITTTEFQQICFIFAKTKNDLQHEQQIEGHLQIINPFIIR
jgi:predicted nucleic acid-binding protein